MGAEHRLSGSTRLAGVIGWPVAHSRSPQMHNAAYAALGMDWAYVALPVEPQRLEAGLRGLAALGFAGVNVTIPHKQGVAALCDEVSGEAQGAGSVNTVLVREDGSLYGETTDGRGMVNALGGELPETALVLGGGGAARAAVAALVANGVDVTVSARRAEAAVELADELGATAGAWPSDLPAGLIVNATPVGQSGAADELPLDEALISNETVVCDLAYRGDGAPTGLVALGRARGARTVDGIDVLVGQGLLSFKLFTGQDPPAEVMAAAARG
jgi:shikimate dehydrogenase